MDMNGLFLMEVNSMTECSVCHYPILDNKVHECRECGCMFCDDCGEEFGDDEWVCDDCIQYYQAPIAEEFMR